jgi:peptide/nickel transport system substrate-binding protein
MENRFGVKDLFLLILIVALIVLVVLGMFQYDRQWKVLQETRDKLNEQTGELAFIRQRLQAGGSGGISIGAGDPNSDMDIHVREAHTQPDFSPGGVVIDVSPVVPQKLTPLLDGDLYGMRMQGYVLDTLCERDERTLEWRPRLAKTWTVSPDGKVVEFNLRPNVVFSNGDPLTSDDVKFTLEMTLNEKIECPALRSTIDKLDHVETDGPLKVKFVFKEPFYASFESAALTQVISRKFYSKYSPEEFNTSAGLLLGSGPYRLVDPTGWKPEPGKPVELVRNERYWGEPPGMDKLIWRVIDEPSSQLISLRNGEVNTFYDMMNPNQFEEVKKDPSLAPRMNVFSLPVANAGYFWIGWNETRDGKDTHFHDKRVRKALTMLIDREAIVRTIYKGYGDVISGPFSPSSPQADSSIKPLPFDPAAAEKLLAEAGFHREGGTMIGPDGKPFRFQVMHGSKREVGIRIGKFTQDALARVGISCEPVPTEWANMEQKLKERTFDAVIMGWGGGSIESDPYQMFSTVAMKGIGNNYVQYSNPEVDKAIEAARSEIDESKRMKLWNRVHQILAEDQPYTFLFADKQLSAINNEIKGLTATKLGVNQKVEWYVPKGSSLRKSAR